MKKREQPKREKPKREQPPTPARKDANWAMIRWHLRVGWWSLLLFLSLGIILEAMHGFKVQWYVGDQNSTRRLMWTLAHAHGTLLALVHLAYASAIHLLGTSFERFHLLRSRSLSVATLLLPAGFFAGGLVIYDGDPGLGILLVPIGAGLFFLAVLLTAISVELSPRSQETRGLD